MGVSNLTTLIFNEVPNGFFDIDIKEEIKIWKLKNPNQTPKIVVDEPSFVNGLFNRYKLDILCGNRNLQNVEFVKKILRNFKSLGVELIFFRDGRCQPKKINTVAKRCESKHQCFMRITKDIANGVPLQDLKKGFLTIQKHNSLFIENEVKKSCTYFKAYYHECDTEIAAYASKHNAMAIIADDSDFLIYPGKWKYWSAQQLRLNAGFVTKEYNRNALREFLGLTEDQMPILATLIGNDLVHADTSFLSQSANKKYKFFGAAKIIKTLPIEESSLHRRIAELLFPGDSTDDKIELIASSFHMYNLKEVEEDYNFSDEISAALGRDCPAIVIILGYAKSIGFNFIDETIPGYENYFDLKLIALKRIYGIVLHHKNDSTLTVPIKRIRNSKYVMEDITPEYPPFSIPHIVDIYNEKKNVKYMVVRKLKMVCWILDTKLLNYKKIQKIHHKYLCSILALVFLVEHKFIKIVEADAILHTIIEVDRSYDSISTLIHPKKLALRPFLITHIYGQIVHIVHRSFKIVGLCNFVDIDLFDGVYFHKKFDQIISMPNSERMNLFTDVLNLRYYDTES